uniref:hypothetical protein n=1 Tax=Limosilactobacillus reuteri TaxID=1598 RepID=UPI00146C8C68|nr:hypothetical protein [Limosilactobacillus reuteri]
MAMKLNIDENIVERCGSEEACGAWYFAGLGIYSLDCLVEVEKGLLNGVSLGIELTKQSIIVFIASQTS